MKIKKVTDSPDDDLTKSRDIRKMISGSRTPDKHVATTGGGYNYCPDSIGVSTPKDNYTVSVGSTKNRAENTRKYTGLPILTEAETEMTDEPKEVTDVNADATTPDN